MCQTYFVLTCTKYTVNRYPNKYIFNSIRISSAMEILIPSTASTATIFLILSYSHAYSWLTSFKITSLQDKLYSLSVGIRGFLEFDIFLGHRQRSILSNNPLDKWCHSETSFLRRCETEKNLSHADGQQSVSLRLFILFLERFYHDCVRFASLQNVQNTVSFTYGPDHRRFLQSYVTQEFCDLVAPVSLCPPSRTPRGLNWSTSWI
jgi:hypothetical protein